MIRLKEEIHINGAEILSLSKWKITIIAGLAVIGLGWKDFKTEEEAGALLASSVGFFCAYIDWFIYKRYITIHTIAKFIREQRPEKEQDRLMVHYELFMSDQRENGKFFLSDKWPPFLASSIACFVLPFFALQIASPENHKLIYGLSIVGFLMVAILFGVCRRNRMQLDKSFERNFGSSSSSNNNPA